MDRSELVDEVATDLFGYVMEGQLRDDDIAAVAKPTGFSKRYARYQALLDLHFVLSPDVRSFVESLPTRIRSIKTATERHQESVRGDIKGRVRWNETYKLRAERGNTDRSVFRVEQRQEAIATPENKVLAAVLRVIDDALSAAKEYLSGSSKWATDTWLGDGQLRETFTRLYNQNVHVSRLRAATSDSSPTGRALTAAETARDPIYREAAMLYRRYEQYQAGDLNVIRDLLEETTITPDDSATLFELFVLFKVIKAFETVSDRSGGRIGDVTLNSIVSGRDAVAEYDGEREFRVFYDQAGGALGLSFRTAPTDRNISHLSRSEAVALLGSTVPQQYFKRGSQPFYTKRPDVLVAAKNPAGEETTAENLVIEVKYSSRKKRIQQGIEELLSYLAFMRRDGEFVFDEPGFGGGTNGILVIQDIAEETDVLSPEEQANLPITVIHASEVSHELPIIVEEILCRDSENRLEVGSE